MCRLSISPALMLLALGLPLALQAQVAVGTSTIAGRVTNAVTGEPLDGAVLRLFPFRVQGGPRGSFTTTSQADGGFHFDSVGAGTYLLRGERTGYLPTSRFSPADQIQLAAGQFRNDVQLKLTPESTITGKVYDDAGKPIAGARVRALQKVLFSGRVDLQDRSSGDTDQTGAFAVAKLRPGRYVLVADPPPTISAGEQEDPAVNPNGDLVTTFFPHALNVDEADEIEVGAGYSPSDEKLYLKRAAAYHIRGRIAQGVGTSRQLMLLPAPPQGGASTALARKVAITKDGRFDVGGVVSGDYVLRAIGGRRTQLLGRADVAVSGGDANDVVVAAVPPVTVSGTISTSDDNLANISGAVHLVARPLANGYTGGAVAQVANDGTFRFNELDPDEYLFSVAPGANGYYVKSVISNGQDVRGRPIDLSQFPSVKLEVSLQSGAATINGGVQVAADDDPSGISVVLVPKQVDAIGSNVQFRSTQRGGAFAFTNLAPDDYTLYAVHRVDVDVWQNVTFLQQIASAGTAVEVAENQQQQVQLKLIPYEQIADAAMRAGVPEE